MKMYPERIIMEYVEEKPAESCALYRSAAVTLTPSSLVLRITMDLFEHRYYRLSKILMMVIGQWPYQSTNAKRGYLAILISLTAFAIVPQGLAVVKYRNDQKILLECFIRYMFGAISFIKLLSFMVHSQKRLKLVNLIRTDWQVWAREREVNILHGYAEQGEKIAFVYTDLLMLRIAVMYSIFFVFMTQPLIPTIIDVTRKNGTVPREFPYPIVYYNIDEHKYYFYLILYSYVCVCLVLTVIISNDVILVIYVQHVCGIFSALGHKFKRIKNNDTSVQRRESPHTVNKKDMTHVASCIARHNDAIEYANLIEASYTRTFFITAGLGMVLINAAGLQVLMRSSDPTTTIMYILFVLALMLYFFIECYVSQTLIDHSISIRYYIYDSQWYRLSPNAQRMLPFMTMRCTVPCHLTAGKMMIMSVRTFWLVLKTTVSYFGFLRSSQGL